MSKFFLLTPPQRLIEPNEKEKSQSSGMVGKKRGLSPIIPESEGKEFNLVILNFPSQYSDFEE